ncbi:MULTISPECIES: hypothetical protein [unclassified Microbacterium]|uniref:hypothetical protein n=1 Tax=unclassified Microbacterium TaxID=2609290 RepID=UPI00214CFA5D|nr:MULTISPECIES: hypothetical protein [unclassified Microbacterium]MCR2810267.1 hypothetical protein [Microbacterium sp. zg.B185]WIM19904.1 hypothetical protein QNO12_03605 [Microbacterium sp. zg-B185]
MVNRHALPRWGNALIDAIADAPMSPLGRLAAKRMGRPAPRGSIPSTVFADRPRRVLIAPVNYSAQGVAWARALEQADDTISARNMAVDVPGGFSFDADLVVPVGTYHNDPDWQRRQFEAACTATHVLIEAEEPPFGRMLGRSVAAQASALVDRGVDVAFLAHGTDVRLPSRHMADNEWSHYADPAVYAPRAETLAARNIALLETSGRRVFVSTPDLLADVPSAAWCPVVVDPARWATVREQREPGRPLRVVHAPSHDAVKGTELILSTLERLEDAGLIELELVRGVPSALMPEVFARADVVLDQFRVGSYGVAACEALAAGCVVIGSLSDAVRDEIRTRTGRDVPIRQASPATLEAVLRDLTVDTRIARIRDAGVDFVRHVHDGTMSAHALISNWIEPHPSSPAEEHAHASDS